MQVLEKKHLEEKGMPVTSGRAPLLAVCLKNFLWFVFGLPLALVLIELVLYCGQLGEECFMQLEAITGFGHIFEKRISWRAEGYSQSTFDKKGWRNPDAATWLAMLLGSNPNQNASLIRDKNAVVMLGDSVVESIQVPENRSFANLIEDKLNNNLQAPSKSQSYKVYNLGTSAYGTIQEYLQYLQHAKKLNPETVVLFYHQGDNYDNTFLEGVNNFLPRPYCRLDSDKNLVIDWQFYKQYMEGDQASFYKLFDFLRRNSRIYGTYEKVDLMLASDQGYQSFKRTATKKMKNVCRFLSKIGGHNQITNSKSNSTKSSAAIVDSPESKTPAGPICSKADVLELERIVSGDAAATANLDPALAPERSLSPYQKELKCNDDRMVLTAGVISAFAKTCKADGCRFVLVGFPGPADNLLYQRELNCIERLSQSKLGQFQFIDLNEEFAGLSNKEKADAFFIYGDHLKAKGHMQTAEILYRRIYGK